MAEQARMEIALRHLPKLEKQWVASMCPLESHRAIHGAHVPVRESFIIDGEEIMFPYDPAASSRNTVDCSCDILAWTKDTARLAPLSGRPSKRLGMP
jgi:hypothetical protein